MKYIKMLGLAVIAAAALTAFVGAGTASATVLCKTTLTTGCAAAGQDYPSGTAFELTLEGSMEFVYNGSLEITCTGSTIKGATSNTGSSTTTVSGKTSSTTWSSCTYPATTKTLGVLEIHHIAGTDNGTLTASGFEVNFQQIFGTCTYRTGTANDLDTIKGGNPATIMISTSINGGGAFGCGGTTTWTASYAVTTPKPLYISAS